MRHTVRKLMTLSSRELLTLCQASVLLTLAEVSVRIWSLKTILHALERRTARAQAASGGAPASEMIMTLARLVELADRHGLFRPSCLRQALVVAWLLGRRGAATSLRIGVTKEDGQLQAHAWLEVPGTPRISVFADPDYATLS
jgi:hypothetical protein